MTLGPERRTEKLSNVLELEDLDKEVEIQLELHASPNEETPNLVVVLSDRTENISAAVVSKPNATTPPQDNFKNMMFACLVNGSTLSSNRKFVSREPSFLPPFSLRVKVRKIKVKVIFLLHHYYYYYYLTWRE